MYQRDRDPYLRFLGKPSSRRFDAFARAYLGVVRRLAGHIAADDSTADEIAQEVLLKLGRNWTPPGEIRDPRAYILRCVLNEHRSLVRSESVRSRREKEAGMAQARRVEASPEEKLAKREVLEQTLSALAGLPQDFRVPLHLWAVEGLSYDEISEATGVERDTIGTRIHRAREKLREVLGLSSLSLAFSSLSEARENGVFFFDGLPPGLPIQGHVCGVTRDGQSVEDRVFHVQVKEGETSVVTVQIP